MESVCSTDFGELTIRQLGREAYVVHVFFILHLRPMQAGGENAMFHESPQFHQTAMGERHGQPEIKRVHDERAKYPLYFESYPFNYCKATVGHHPQQQQQPVARGMAKGRTITAATTTRTRTATRVAIPWCLLVC